MTTTNHYPAPGEKLQDHPIAQIFPMADVADRETMRKSLKEAGQLDDIVLLDGMILDGRNRWELLTELHIEPRFCFYDPNKHGKSPTQYVLAKNLARRNLTISQRAAIAVTSLPFLEAEAKERSKQNLKRGGTTSNSAGAEALAPVPAPEDESQEQPEEEWSSNPNGESQPAPSNGNTPSEEQQMQQALEICRSQKEEGKGISTSLIQRRLRLGYISANCLLDKMQARGWVGKADGTNPRDILTLPGEESATPGDSAITDENKRSRDIAAESVGVSPRIVQDAKTIQAESPELLEQVKAGEITINAATRKLSKASKAREDIETAIGRIQQVCGKSLADAVRDGTRLKGKEAVTYANQTDDEMLAQRSLIESGWPVKKARAYKVQALTRTHSIGDLINRTVANGGTYLLEIEGFEVDVRRKG